LKAVQNTPGAGPPTWRTGLLASFVRYCALFREASKEAKDAVKHGRPEKHVARLNAGPGRYKLKSPDADTLDEYLLAKPGFFAKLEVGRLWV
jgi:hypothetical protein